MPNPSSTSCRGYTRSQALRRSFAQAGRGLPAIEPGMPLPAGTGLSRREFALRSLGLALAVYGGRALAPAAMEHGIASASASGDGRVIVSICAGGGLDALSLLAPVGDPLYATLRPSLALKEGDGTPFSEDDRLMWHPLAAPLATLHGEGKVAVAPAIGYTGPNQSHFTSRHYWEVGQLDTGGHIGWLGRYLDVDGAADNPLQGLSLGPALQPSLAPSTVPVATLPFPDRYTLTATGVDATIQSAMLDSWNRLGQLTGGDAGQQRARQAVRATALLREQLAPVQGLKYTSPVAYPTDPKFGSFPAALSTVAEMLSEGLPLRCVAIDAPGGYDTHAHQVSTLQENMTPLFSSLLAFQRDLEARALDDRVIVHLWSEFGRRPRENGDGTDHGAGGVSVIIGSRINGQMIGEFPGLATLDANDNVRVTSDFRGLYASVLEQWLGADPEQLLPGSTAFNPPALIKAA